MAAELVVLLGTCFSLRQARRWLLRSTNQKDDYKFALAFEIARLSATSNVPRLLGQHNERKRHRHGRALGMALTFAMQSGTGWSLRARRSLPSMRLPLGVRDSPLFTACEPVPPPAEVPTRPAANSSYV